PLSRQGKLFRSGETVSLFAPDLPDSGPRRARRSSHPRPCRTSTVRTGRGVGGRGRLPPRSRPRRRVLFRHQSLLAGTAGRLVAAVLLWNQTKDCPAWRVRDRFSRSVRERSWRSRLDQPVRSRVARPHGLPGDRRMDHEAGFGPCIARVELMQFHPTRLPGAWRIQLEPAHDSRGYFARTFCVDEFAAHGLETSYPQHSISYSAHKGTIRGMHYQREPDGEVKVVR